MENGPPSGKESGRGWEVVKRRREGRGKVKRERSDYGERRNSRGKRGGSKKAVI